MKNPWMKFYPADWRAEPKLKLISRAARSLWLDMLGLMFEAGTGRLEIDGRPMTPKELAAMLGDNPRTVKKLLAEIENAGVSSRDQHDFICSRRVIRDFEKAEKDKSNGRKGGNPQLKNNGLAEKGVNPEDKAHIPEARSQSTVSKDTGASAASDRQFWATGKAYLADHGVSAPGRLIGKWCRDHGQPQTARAITQAQIDRAVDPISYIEKILRKAKEPAREEFWI